MVDSEGRLGLSFWQKAGEWGIRNLLLFFAIISVLTTAGIIGILIAESWAFFQHVAPAEFFFGKTWAPLFEPRSFGVLPLLCGTLLIAGGAMLLALPVGLAIAIYTAEYSQGIWQKVLKPSLELLAGIPSVVYGYFALTEVTPMLQHLVPDAEVFNAASATIAIAIMVLPTIASMADDALKAVPKTLREGAYALGARRSEVITGVVVPAALSGIFAALFLAFSRAVGETMVVAIAAGATPRLTLNPFLGVQAMTAYIAQVALGDVATGSLEYESIFAVGFVLFLMTMAANMLSRFFIRRFGRTYG